MKREARRDDGAVSSHIGVALVVGLTVMVAAVIGAQAVELGGSQPGFAHSGVEVDFDGNDGVEVVYLADGGQADYIEVTFSDSSATGTARLHRPGTQVTLNKGVITTTGNAELVRQPDGSLGESVRVTAVAFKSGSGEVSSTLIYQGCRGRCTSPREGFTHSKEDTEGESTDSEDKSTCTGDEEEDKDAGHGNNCDGTDPDNPGKGGGRDNPGMGNSEDSPKDTDEDSPGKGGGKGNSGKGNGGKPGKGN